MPFASLNVRLLNCHRLCPHHTVFLFKAHSLSARFLCFPLSPRKSEPLILKHSFFCSLCCTTPASSFCVLEHVMSRHCTAPVNAVLDDVCVLTTLFLCSKPAVFSIESTCFCAPLSPRKIERLFLKHSVSGSLYRTLPASLV